MKKFFLAVLRVEVLLGLGALIGASLFAAADVLASFAGRLLPSMDAVALQWLAGLSVLVAVGLVAVIALGRRAGRGLANE
ncbi:hypothetical protein [Roseateles sp.]|uniref:hypothetical protein n=1 Tax=Roseateles sp. TaxID=1971397 RepID=UPI003265C989